MRSPTIRKGPAYGRSAGSRKDLVMNGVGPGWHVMEMFLSKPPKARTLCLVGSSAHQGMDSHQQLKQHLPGNYLGERRLG